MENVPISLNNQKTFASEQTCEMIAQTHKMERNNTNGNEYLTAIDLIWFFFLLLLFTLFHPMHLIYLLDLFFMLSEHNNNQLCFFPSAATVTENRFKLSSSQKKKRPFKFSWTIERKGERHCVSVVSQCLCVTFILSCINFFTICMAMSFLPLDSFFKCLWITIEWVGESSDIGFSSVWRKETSSDWLNVVGNSAQNPDRTCSARINWTLLYECGTKFLIHSTPRCKDVVDWVKLKSKAKTMWLQNLN